MSFEYHRESKMISERTSMNANFEGADFTAFKNGIKRLFAHFLMGFENAKLS